MLLCLCPSHPACVWTPCLECVHASVHVFYVHPDCPYMLHPVCIVWWKPRYPCISVCLCPGHLISVPTTCLECAPAWVHEFMSTWLPMAAPVPMHSLMETLVSLYGCLFVSQLHHFCSQTLFRTCTCIRIWINVHLSTHVCSIPLLISFMEIWCAPVCHCVWVPVTLLVVPHFGYNVYMHQYMDLGPSWLPISAPPCMHSLMETWVSSV